MTQKELRAFNVRYMKFKRETKQDISYEKYLFNYELTSAEIKAYTPFLSPFIRKRNMLARMLRTDNYAIVYRLMRKQIKDGKLPNQYLLFLREYYPQT